MVTDDVNPYGRWTVLSGGTDAWRTAHARFGEHGLSHQLVRGIDIMWFECGHNIQGQRSRPGRFLGAAMTGLVQMPPSARSVVEHLVGALGAVGDARAPTTADIVTVYNVFKVGLRLARAARKAGA